MCERKLRLWSNQHFRGMGTTRISGALRPVLDSKRLPKIGQTDHCWNFFIKRDESRTEPAAI